MSFALLSFLLALPAAQGQVLYTSDFESDDGGFTPTQGFAWEHGTPVIGPGAAHSGTKCWGTGLTALPASGAHRLVTPEIDASDVPLANAVRVRWWQYIDTSTGHYLAAYATHAAGFNQLFGRRSIGGTPHVGWRRVEVILDRSFLAPDLQLEFYVTSATAQYFIDDVEVVALRLAQHVVEDFEAGTGGFTLGPGWTRGTPSMGCPFSPSAFSGQFCIGTAFTLCGYSNDADFALTSPVLDLSPYAGHSEIYLTWQATGYTEFGFDGVHHEISFDGGASWETTAGYLSSFGPYPGWNRFGIPVDPSATPSVRLRWRLVSDGLETEWGLLFDDFGIALPLSVRSKGARAAGPPTTGRTISGG
jgi:hypothetical protein